MFDNIDPFSIGFKLHDLLLSSALHPNTAAALQMTTPRRENHRYSDLNYIDRVFFHDHSNGMSSWVMAVLGDGPRGRSLIGILHQPVDS